MGAPYFKYKELLDRMGVVVCSSNYELYSDLSSRVMETIASLTDALEIYSIDEAFLRLDREEEAIAIRKKVLQWTGIPTSIGIAKNKTLAKVANHIAKDKGSGVKMLIDKEEISSHLKTLPVEEIWGIGRRLGTRLRALGASTALEFREMSETKLRGSLGVVPLRTALELRGETAFELEEHPEPKQGVVSSRSFGRPVTTWEEMEEAIALHAGKAAAKIRDDGSQATYLQVFLLTNRFNPLEATYSRVASGALPGPTDFTPALVQKAKSLAKPLFYKNVSYKKCGVFLGGLVPRKTVQEDLFIDRSRREKEEKLMALLDEEPRLFFLSEGIKRGWKMKRDHTSSQYTTSWDYLLTIKI
jgi:DNA polymerase V